MASGLSRSTSRDPNQRFIGNFFKSSEVLWLVVCDKNTRTNICQVMPVTRHYVKMILNVIGYKVGRTVAPAASSYLFADVTHTRTLFPDSVGNIPSRGVGNEAVDCIP